MRDAEISSCRSALPPGKAAPASAANHLTLLSLGHGVTDVYSNFLPGLIVLLAARMHLTNTLVGVLAMVISLSGSMSQLLYGYLTDRMRRGYFLIVGPATAAIFMSLLGCATSVPMLILLLALGGSGVACFHPQAAVAVGRGQKERRGFDLAVFVTAGSAGYSLGPLAATGAVVLLGQERIWLASLPGLLTALVLYATLFRRAVPDERRNGGRWSSGEGEAPAPEPPGEESASGAPESAAGAHRSRMLLSLILLWAIVALRASVTMGLMHFMPLFLKERGASAFYGSLAVSLFLFAGAAGGMAGGSLSDRLGRRRVLVSSLALSTPLLSMITLVPAQVFLGVLVVASFVLSASSAVNVAMAQELVPSHQGTASAVVQGCAFGTGGLLAIGLGAIADRTSIALVYQGLAIIPMLTVAIALLLPETAPMPSRAGR